MTTPVLHYFLPKKLLKVTFPLTIIEQVASWPDGRTTIVPFKALIKGEFRITPVLVPDESLGKFDYEPAESSLSKTTLNIEFDAEGAGLLLSMNSQQTNMIGDIIGAAVDVAASVGGLVSAFAGLSIEPGSAGAPTISYPEREVGIVALVDPTLDGTRSIELPAFESASGQPDKPVPVPVVSLSFKRYAQTEYVVRTTADKKELTGDQKKSIWYLEARPVEMTVIIENNSYIRKHIVAREILYFPQFGPLREQPIVRKNWWQFGSMNTALDFSPSTGSLQKVCISSEGNIKDWLTDAKLAANSLKTSVGIAAKAAPR